MPVASLSILSLALGAVLAAPTSSPAPVATAVGVEPYKSAPSAIREVLDAATSPSIRVSPTGKHALLTRTALYPTIEELAAPMLRLAGVRFDPANRASHGGRHIAEITVRALPDGVERKVALPANARIEDLRWNAAGTKVAMLNVTDDATELWVLDVDKATAKRVPKVVVNATLGDAVDWMPDGERLIVRTVVPKRAAPPSPRAPVGPRVESGARGTVASSTYEARDLLRSPHDADLFEHYATSQLAIVETSGRVKKLGAPAVFADFEVSPDGRHLWVARVQRPYSFARPYWRFPMSVELWDTSGKRIETIADLPLADAVPIDGVRLGPRDLAWIPTRAATLVWVEALDDGDTYKPARRRDRLMMKEVGKPAVPWLETVERYAGTAWLEDGKRGLVYEIDRDEHRTRTTLVDIADPTAGARVVWDRSYEDRYGDPGTPISRPLPNGRWVVRLDGDAIFLAGEGASPQGERPFLDRLDLGTLTTTRQFRSAGDRREEFVAWADLAKGSFYTVRQTATSPRNLVLRTLGAPSEAGAGEAVRSSTDRELTAFVDPTPQIRKVERRIVQYERADGVPLSFTLYLPPDYREGTRMPTVLWAYPVDYNEAKNAGQLTKTASEFTTVVGASPIFLALAGYVVLDDVAMPVIGPSETVYDTFLEQIEDNARAAIDKAVELGVTDRDRVGVFGHSHGALMTANLLAWTDLFRAGVARSGAYNHTTRPFGFQNERRSMYKARDNYLKLSPLLHADRIDEPLLLIHGEVDANPGTVPLQSEKLFEAVRGTGGTTRLVMLPHESHAYIARESVEHVLAETVAWFDAHVKHAGARAKKPTRPQPKTAPKSATKTAPVMKWQPSSPAASATTTKVSVEPSRKRDRRAKRQKRRRR
jgi:dipeptidyl aminopeptidase/acylaminoacyl peptidase